MSLFFIACMGFVQKKAHKHKPFGPVDLGTIPSLSQEQTQVVPGTNPNRGFLLILHRGSPVCPRDKPSLSVGQAGVEGQQIKFMCVTSLCAFSL